MTAIHWPTIGENVATLAKAADPILNIFAPDAPEAFRVLYLIVYGAHSGDAVARGLWKRITAGEVLSKAEIKLYVQDRKIRPDLNLGKGG